MPRFLRYNKYSENLHRYILFHYFHNKISVSQILNNLKGRKPSKRLIYLWINEYKSEMDNLQPKKRVRKSKEAVPDPAFASNNDELLYYRKYLQIDKLEGDIKKKLDRDYLMSIKAMHAKAKNTQKS